MNLLSITQLMHNIGMAWGVGGATILTILMIKSEKMPESAPHIMRVIPAISRLIGIAVILLIVSGIPMMFLIAWPISKTVLMIKHVVVLLLVINGVYMALRIVPGMKKLAPRDGEGPSEEFLKIKVKSKISGMLGLFLWYLILVLSALM